SRYSLTLGGGNFRLPGPMRPSDRIRWPVVVLYRSSSTGAPRADELVSTYACAPVLLRSTRNTPLRRCSTLRAWRVSGPPGELVGRGPASLPPPVRPSGPAAKPGNPPSAVRGRAPGGGDDRP